MFKNKRVTIGVLICDISSDYQTKLCKEISAYASRVGFNVAFFTCFTAYGSNSQNARGEFNIINLPPYEKFDAIILCPDTFVNDKQMYTLREHLSRCDGPIVCIRRALDDYYSVLIDDQNAIAQIVDHFVTVHQYKRIAFMSGPSDHPDSIARLKCYKEALEKVGIPYDENLVFEGDFWKNKAKDAVRYFTTELDTLPDAIVCANDYMAISVCMEFVLNGYLVPEDIAISGFDNITEAANNMPPLTTLAVAVEELADKAMEVILNVLNGKHVQKTNYISCNVLIRNSCGCNVFDMKTMIVTRVRQIEEYDSIINRNLNNTFTSIALEGLDDCLSIGCYLHLLDYEDNNMRNFFLCLGEGKLNTYPKYRSNRAGYARKSHSIYSFVDRKEIETSIFPTNELLPPEATVDEPMMYYFFPIHHLDYNFGYLSISYYNNYTCDKTFNGWVAIIGNAIENVRVSNESNRLLNELNNLYIHDSLTGLYNRRGFEQISTQQYSSAMRTGKAVMILGIDMDNLKKVNDKYGHIHGDLALKTIGGALSFAAEHGEVCARVGGDEFNIIGIDYSEEKASGFINRFYQYLDDFNKSEGHPYLVDASFGYVLSTKEDDHTLEDCINLSDKKLYEQKRAKKAKRHS